MKKPVVQKEKVVITPHPPKDTTPATSQESPAVGPETDPKENPSKEVAKDQVDTEVE